MCILTNTSKTYVRICFSYELELVNILGMTDSHSGNLISFFFWGGGGKGIPDSQISEHPGFQILRFPAFSVGGR